MANIICGIDPGLGVTGYAVVRLGGDGDRRAAIAVADIAGPRGDSGFTSAAPARPGSRVVLPAVAIAMGFGEAAIVDAGVCRTDASLPLPARLAQLDADISAVFDEHRPVLVAVEKLYAHYRHPRTAIMMGHARGVILCAAARRGVAVRDLSATAVKRFLTGHGHASKAAVQRAIQVSLGLDRLPEPPDVADALAIALACTAPGFTKP